MIAVDAEIAQVVTNGTGLLDLFERHSPRTFAAGENMESWPVLSTSLMIRAQHTLASTLTIQEREIDAAVLARVVYEHVVTLAWLGVAPADHIPRFVRTEVDKGRALAAGTAKYEPREPGNTRASDLFDELERGAAPKKGGMPSVEQRAAEADAHWMRRIAGLPGFSPGYDILYRFYSGMVHPSLIGMHWFWRAEEGNLNRTVPALPHPKAPASAAVHAFASGLLVTHACFGWPPATETLATFTRGVGLMRSQNQWANTVEPNQTFKEVAATGADRGKGSPL